jgi:hypothetical protein
MRRSVWSSQRRLRKPVSGSLRAACSNCWRRMMFSCTASLFERRRFARRTSRPSENSCEDSESHQKVSSFSTRSCVGSSATTVAVATLPASSDSSPTVSPWFMYASGLPPSNSTRNRPETTTKTRRFCSPCRSNCWPPSSCNSRARGTRPSRISSPVPCSAWSPRRTATLTPGACSGVDPSRAPGALGRGGLRALLT